MTVTGDTVPGLGPLESAIMTVVWDAGQPLTVRGLTSHLLHHL
jgi:predicted transcriptional regulator